MRPRPLRLFYSAFDRAAPVVYWAELIGGIVGMVLALCGILPSVQFAVAVGFVVLAHQGYDALADEAPPDGRE